MGEFKKRFSDLGYFDENSDGFRDFMEVIDEARRELPKENDIWELAKTKYGFHKGDSLSEADALKLVEILIEHFQEVGEWYEKWFVTKNIEKVK